jgi:riboflavin kinase/FMN adenylyltransferase
MKEEKSGEQISTVFTFDVPPKKVFTGQKLKKFFCKERYDFFEKLGIDVLIEYPFNKKTASMSPEDFVKDILYEQLGTN